MFLCSCQGCRWRPVVSTQPAVNVSGQEILTAAGVSSTTCKLHLSCYTCAHTHTHTHLHFSLDFPFKQSFVSFVPLLSKRFWETNKQTGGLVCLGLLASPTSMTPGPVPSFPLLAALEHSGTPLTNPGQLSDCFPGGARPGARAPSDPLPNQTTGFVYQPWNQSLVRAQTPAALPGHLSKLQRLTWGEW